MAYINDINDQIRRTALLKLCILLTGENTTKGTFKPWGEQCYVITVG